ncbi:GNAT family acetyltransferase (plasmid) [Natrialba magadii ATCC 43099]|uniref:GNAT family acetyltransferase n=1 Tax=Natrialba magadii (strain ATCC 43099 / DSM 3394 / CCM 3739 / CIP 104546 / IAM 13178 / JCM 8861 / NBRC 102185 / NCIMB 2190 / MS3) TaxID=547559 RepID=D3T1K9_NATMM|nr:GNAT family N-acetyltransferase [Natrialba magadii]ADD07468.1 GNAT family acetyltransferase [Natrialba magadii ATCC 43099]ELY32186.1 N-acetyltransferase GCN5 [Natrialba magadii ATCC 43099]
MTAHNSDSETEMDSAPAKQPPSRPLRTDGGSDDSEAGHEIDIREIESLADVRDVFPILVELRDHLDEEQYLEHYVEMAGDGYTMFACDVDGDPVAVAGVKITTNFYLGRHAYVYDLVTTEGERSKGYGRRLLEYVHEWAADHGCEAVELESGLWRDEAHAFYEDLGYEKYCYSFTYDLS